MPTILNGFEVEVNSCLKNQHNQNTEDRIVDQSKRTCIKKNDRNF